MDQLPQRLKSLKEATGLTKLSSPDVGRSFAAHAMRASVDMIAAIVVGAGLGYFVDGGLGTTPWFLMVGFVLGSAAGFLTIYRMVKRLMADDLPK